MFLKKLHISVKLGSPSLFFETKTLRLYTMSAMEVVGDEEKQEEETPPERTFPDMGLAQTAYQLESSDAGVASVREACTRPVPAARGHRASILPTPARALTHLTRRLRRMR